MGLLASSASSLGGFCLAVSMAHDLNSEEFGMFAIASSLYILLAGITRAAVIEPLLAIGSRIGDLSAATHRASLVGLVAAMPLVLAGILLNSPFLVATGIAAHGLTMYEFRRTVSLAVANPRNALAQDVAWCIGALLLATGMGLGLVDGQLGYTIWVGVGAIIGYVATFSAKISFTPKWSPSRITTTTAAQFGGDFLVGSGSATLTTNVLGAVAGVSTVAALRAAGTMFGPVTLVVAVARTLTIPFLQQLHKRSDGSEIVTAVRVTSVLVCLAVGPLVFVAFLPASIGTLALGQNWPTAEPLLPFLSIEALLVIVATVPFAGHRVYLAGGATLIIRSGLACLRISCVVAAGVLAGAMAAAATMSGVALIGAFAWWFSYLARARAASPADSPTNAGGVT